jgi:hypothetical protein
MQKQLGNYVVYLENYGKFMWLEGSSKRWARGRERERCCWKVNKVQLAQDLNYRAQVFLVSPEEPREISEKWMAYSGVSA